MLILKLYYHIMCFFKKIFYKIIYGKYIKFGKKVTFRKGFSLMIAKGAYVKIGDGCFFNNFCAINAVENIEIGANCLFGENVKLYDHNHIFSEKGKNIKEQGFKHGRIVIEDNCWICTNVVILKDVTIGKNSVVGAGVVLKRSVDRDSLIKNENNYKVEKIKYD